VGLLRQAGDVGLQLEGVALVDHAFDQDRVDLGAVLGVLRDFDRARGLRKSAEHQTGQRRAKNGLSERPPHDTLLGALRSSSFG
jgi:hypothetical protein